MATYIKRKNGKEIQPGVKMMLYMERWVCNEQCIVSGKVITAVEGYNLCWDAGDLVWPKLFGKLD